MPACNLLRYVLQCYACKSTLFVTRLLPSNICDYKCSSIVIFYFIHVFSEHIKRIYNVSFVRFNFRDIRGLDILNKIFYHKISCFKSLLQQLDLLLEMFKQFSQVDLRADPVHSFPLKMFSNIRVIGKLLQKSNRSLN